MFNELLTGKGGIIRLPAGAAYQLKDISAVISYAATSTANSVEAAVAELKRKQPDATIPSADTVFKYLATNEVKAVLRLDREFFNLSSIRTLSSLQVNFIMAVPSNKRIRRLWEEHKRENGITPAIFTYQFKAQGSPAFFSYRDT